VRHYHREFQIIFPSVIAVVTTHEESDWPEANAGVTALQRDKIENESRSGGAGLPEASLPGSGNGRRLVHRAQRRNFSEVTRGRLGADFRHSSGNARPFEAQ